METHEIVQRRGGVVATDTRNVPKIVQQHLTQDIVHGDSSLRERDKTHDFPGFFQRNRDKNSRRRICHRETGPAAPSPASARSFSTLRPNPVLALKNNLSERGCITARGAERDVVTTESSTSTTADRVFRQKHLMRWGTSAVWWNCE